MDFAQSISLILNELSQFMSGTITQNRDEKLCDAYIKLEHTSPIGHFWKHAVQYQFFIFEELVPALSIECV